MNIDLASTPVWPFSPDWSSPVTETLTWLTSVLSSPSEAEQRVSQRHVPTVQLEMSFLANKKTRREIDAFLARHVGKPFLMPLWHDVHLVGVDGPLDHSQFHLYDMLFQRRPSGKWRAGKIDPLQGPGDTPQTVHEPFYNITNTEGAVWRPMEDMGSRLYPMVVVTCEERVESFQLSNDATRFTARVTLYEPKMPEAEYITDVYQGFPVLKERPDTNEDLRYEYARTFATTNTKEEANRNIVDVVGRMRGTLGYNWTGHNQADVMRLRKILTYLNGRQKAIWVPTFMNDMVLSRPAQAGTAFYIERTGLAIPLGQVMPPGRRNVRILLKDGTHLYQSVNRIVTTNDGDDRVELGDSFAIDFTIDEVAEISFMARSRLAQDIVELNHDTDEHGLTLCTLSWQMIGGDRDPAIEIPEPPSLEDKVPDWQYLLSEPTLGETNAVLGVPTDHPPIFGGTTEDWHQYDRRRKQAFGLQTLRQAENVYIQKPSVTNSIGTTKGINESYHSLANTRRMLILNTDTMVLSAGEIAALTPNPTLYADYMHDRAGEDDPAGFRDRAKASLTNAFYRSVIFRDRGRTFYDTSMGGTTTSSDGVVNTALLRNKFKVSGLPNLRSTTEAAIFRARMADTVRQYGQNHPVAGRVGKMVHAEMGGAVTAMFRHKEFDAAMRGGTNGAQTSFSIGPYLDAVTYDVMNVSASCGVSGKLEIISGGIPLAVVEAAHPVDTNHLSRSGSQPTGGGTVRSDGSKGPQFYDQYVRVLSLAFVFAPAFEETNLIVDVIDVADGSLKATLEVTDSIYTGGLVLEQDLQKQGFKVAYASAIIERTEKFPDYTANPLSPTLLEAGKEYIFRVRYKNVAA